MGWLINPYRFSSVIPSTQIAYGNRCVGCNNVRKYTIDGQLLWSRNTSTTNVFGVAMDTEFSVIAGGNVSSNITTRKYDPNGNLLWSVNHGFTVNGIVTDPNNNIYTVGNSATLNGITTRKYDTNGNLIWSRNTNRPTTSIAIDNNNNIYTTAVNSPNEGNTPAIRKYDSDGNLIWSITLTISTANKITVDNSNGDVYFVTDVIPSGEQTWKYDTNGNFIWLFNAINVNGSGIALDSEKNFYVCGPQSSPNGILSKFDSNRNPIWSKTGPGSVRDVKVDNNNNVYTAMEIGNSITNRKYDKDGNVIWTLNQGPISYDIAIR